MTNHRSEETPVLKIKKETESQRRYILKRDADIVAEIKSRNGEPEITHVLPPRAVAWGIMHIIGSHGGDYFQRLLQAQPEQITEYSQISNGFFPTLLHLIRKSSKEIQTTFDEFHPLTEDCSKLEEIYQYYQNFIRFVTTDPRNLIVRSHRQNIESYPEKVTALQDYRAGQEGFAKMQQMRDSLGYNGQVDNLIPDNAENLMMTAMERTTIQTLEEYPNLWRPDDSKESYNTVLSFAQDYNTIEN